MENLAQDEASVVTVDLVDMQHGMAGRRERGTREHVFSSMPHGSMAGSGGGISGGGAQAAVMGVNAGGDHAAVMLVMGGA